MIQILTLSMPFFGLILIGFVAGRWRPLPIEGLGWLNVFIVYISLPALFFQLLSRTPVSQLANGWFIVGTTAATATAFALACLVSLRVNHGNRAEAAIAGAAGGYANIGYMGPGLTFAALGAPATIPTALIFCFDSALIFTLVPLMMALAGTHRRTAGQVVREILGRIFLHPFFLATFAGVGAAATGWRPPEGLDRMLTLLMQASAPCALFALGVTVALRPIREVPRELPAVLAIKLVAHPLLAFACLTLIGGIDPIWRDTAVLMASLPPALSAFVLAQQYDVYVDRASTTILVGTLLAVVTVTAVLYLITHHLLPGQLWGS